MRIYATFDEGGFPTGFWNDDVNGHIPEEAIEISFDQWHELINNNGLRRFENGVIVPAEPSVPAEDAVYSLYKSAFIERLDEDEADALEQALLSEGAKLRQMYHAVEYFRSDDSLFAYLHWIVASTLGAADELNIERANELLAPAQ